MKRLSSVVMAAAVAASTAAWANAEERGPVETSTTREVAAAAAPAAAAPAAPATATPAAPAAARATEPPPNVLDERAKVARKAPRVRRFRFRASLVSFGGEVASTSLESGMNAAGLDQPSSLASLDADAASLLAPIFEIFGLWGYWATGGSEATSYPFSDLRRDAAESLTIGYRLKPRLELAVTVDRDHSRLGETYGHRQEPYAFLSLSREMRSFAALVSYAPAESPLRAGAGVSVNAVRFGQWHEMQSKTRLGLLGEVGLALPARSRVFVDAAAQYRWVSAPKLGPFPVFGEDDERVTTFPSSTVAFSRWQVSFGLGFRL